MNHVEFRHELERHRLCFRWRGPITMAYARGMQALLDLGYVKVYEVRAAS